MLSFSGRASAKSIIGALDKSLAIIEFDRSGNILLANEKFCSVVGYELADIKGRHHSIFIEPGYAHSSEYKEFWAKLLRGDYESREYKRIGKGGREIWIRASYNPVKNARGIVTCIVKQATDITAEKLRNAEVSAKIDAMMRVQAVIEFTPQGQVITANENFLATVGYRLDEIEGRHHSMFVEPDHAKSADYDDFWKKLKAGEYVAAEFKRIGKGGKVVWIRASYNPVFDLDNKVAKVVKFAIDITEWIHAITEIGAGLARLAENDLETRITTSFVPSFEKLRSDFNLSLDTLKLTMSQITDSTSSIRLGTQEISRAADDMSRRTEQQAASIEETASALNEITAAVKRSAEGTDHARQVVAAADDDAKKSAVVVRKAVTAMDAIAGSATQISQIIGVIDEIAFQTNLLALNAGIEAARAGDAGRGFAVVASEVRALAQRSADAAKQIKGLISTSGRHVEEGVKLVTETGKSLERILEQVGEINRIVAEIAAGTKEQATGLDEINKTLNQMDEGTQRNAAMVEESSASTHALSQETSVLADLIGRFRIGTPAQHRSSASAAVKSVHVTAMPPRPAARAPQAPARAKKVVNGAPVARATANWEEF